LSKNGYFSEKIYQMANWHGNESAKTFSVAIFVKLKSPVNKSKLLNHWLASFSNLSHFNKLQKNCQTALFGQNTILSSHSKSRFKNLSKPKLFQGATKQIGNYSNMNIRKISRSKLLIL